jgi:hypothetical protein
MSGRNQYPTQTQEIALLHDGIEIPTDNPLIGLDESRQTLQLNAAVVTEISLPVT